LDSYFLSSYHLCYLPEDDMLVYPRHLCRIMGEVAQTHADLTAPMSLGMAHT